jgi:hypothetical protein
LVASLVGDIRAAAVAVGRSKRLESSDGTWFCWGCGGETEFDVSLHCEFCRVQALERRKARLEREARKSPEDRRWEALARAIRSDDRMTREMAVTLLQRARELPSSTTERTQALNIVFDKRFDSSAPGANWNTYADRALPGDEEFFT